MTNYKFYFNTIIALTRLKGLSAKWWAWTSWKSESETTREWNCLKLEKDARCIKSLSLWSDFLALKGHDKWVQIDEKPASWAEEICANLKKKSSVFLEILKSEEFSHNLKNFNPKPFERKFDSLSPQPCFHI